MLRHAASLPRRRRAACHRRDSEQPGWLWPTTSSSSTRTGQRTENPGSSTPFSLGLAQCRVHVARRDIASAGEASLASDGTTGRRPSPELCQYVDGRRCGGKGNHRPPGGGTAALQVTRPPLHCRRAAI
ncbi:hypothetical protein GUJ93_ZPchr0002g25601 [Zizania palustris]|uniref:Uncharacterized protein n=1 Tax=Zizania palustris TaxID=103762 RepID=A0A8J5VV77_ZIZPA|nr:hypothetical protein GUJ93_ZPchr0002g25601 [Zizania palustris]